MSQSSARVSASEVLEAESATVDHGTTTGKEDNDHPQYALASNTPNQNPSFPFSASHATPPGGNRRGMVDSADTDQGSIVPPNTEFRVMGASAGIETGSSTGSDYELEIVADTGGGLVVLATATEPNANTRKPFMALATDIDNPLYTFVAGDRFGVVGWRNGSGSPGALASVRHAAVMWGVFVEV